MHISTKYYRSSVVVVVLIFMSFYSSLSSVETNWHRACQSRILATPQVALIFILGYQTSYSTAAEALVSSMKVCQVNSAWPSIGGKAQMNQ